MRLIICLFNILLCWQISTSKLPCSSLVYLRTPPKPCSSTFSVASYISRSCLFPSHRKYSISTSDSLSFHASWFGDHAGQQPLLPVQTNMIHSYFSRRGPESPSCAPSPKGGKPQKEDVVPCDGPSQQGSHRSGLLKAPRKPSLLVTRRSLSSSAITSEGIAPSWIAGVEEVLPLHSSCGWEYMDPKTEVPLHYKSGALNRDP
jgi:hypothetical protein